MDAQTGTTRHRWPLTIAGGILAALCCLWLAAPARAALPTIEVPLPVAGVEPLHVQLGTDEPPAAVLPTPELPRAGLPPLRIPAPSGPPPAPSPPREASPPSQHPQQPGTGSGDGGSAPVTPHAATPVPLPAGAPPPAAAIGPAGGTGGVLASAETSGPLRNGVSVIPTAHQASVPRTLPQLRRDRFILLAARSGKRTPTVGATRRSGGLGLTLAPLRGSALAAWILLLLAGSVLIALMCADALGVGPRHDYMRRARRLSGRWPRW